jgi:hypothetical protein
MADVQTFVADENLAPVKKAMKFFIVIRVPEDEQLLISQLLSKSKNTNMVGG